MRFADFGLIEPIVRAITREGYETATPIQAKAIPDTLAGRDVLGCAQTGTGKTAAFALPVLQQLTEDDAAHQTPRLPRCLVLAPTRELACQIADSFRTYGRHLPLRHAVIYGGVHQNPQVAAMRRGVDILIATPGRLLDLMEQGHINLSAVKILVLDEADRMLDMGFIHDIRRIIKQMPAPRQTLMFSATMPASIRQFADQLLRNPVQVQVAPESATADLIEQSVYFVQRANKPDLLAYLVNRHGIGRGIVFTRTKHGADRVVKHLRKMGTPAEAIHGNKSQNARSRSLENFRTGRIPLLIATDVASRGIDIDGITHVINYDLSHDAESYVHRIGRTARAGASGSAMSFCDQDEVPNLAAIQRLIRADIPVITDHPMHVEHTMSGHGSGRGSRSGGAHPRAGRQQRRRKPPRAVHPLAKAQASQGEGRQGGSHAAARGQSQAGNATATKPARARRPRRSRRSNQA